MRPKPFNLQPGSYKCLHIKSREIRSSRSWYIAFTNHCRRQRRRRGDEHINASRGIHNKITQGGEPSLHARKLYVWFYCNQICVMRKTCLSCLCPCVSIWDQKEAHTAVTSENNPPPTRRTISNIWKDRQYGLMLDHRFDTDQLNLYLTLLSPHDALKHHFRSLETEQFSLFFHPPQIIFIHYKLRIATAIRGL